MARIYSQFRSTLLFTLILAFVTFTLGRELDTRSDYHYRSISTRNNIPSDSDIEDALHPAPNKAWFWSGRRGACASEADSVKPLAMSIATANGGATLEQTLSNAGVNMPQFGSSAAAKAAWKFAAGTFAKETSGNAFVVLGTCRADNTWEVTELPALKSGGNVNCVFQYTSADNWTNPSLLWAAPGQEAACNIVIHNKAALFGRSLAA